MPNNEDIIDRAWSSGYHLHFNKHWDSSNNLHTKARKPTFRIIHIAGLSTLASLTLSKHRYRYFFCLCISKWVLLWPKHAPLEHAGRTFQTTCVLCIFQHWKHIAGVYFRCLCILTKFISWNSDKVKTCSLSAVHSSHLFIVWSSSGWLGGGETRRNLIFTLSHSVTANPSSHHTVGLITSSLNLVWITVCVR